jgi:serine/threonine-protein phosphatase 6 regulatory ankyrin repeat subunit B
MKKRYFVLLFLLAASSLSLAGIRENQEYIRAAGQGDVDKVRELLNAGVDVDVKVTQYEITALMAAAADGNIEMMELLFSAGANVNIKSSTRESVLGVAVRERKPESVKFLLRNGARIKSLRSSSPATYRGMQIPQHNEVADALILAVHRDDVELLEMLLGAGADVDAGKLPGGRTALMETAYYGNGSMVELLLKKGAAVNLEDEKGKTAFTYALYPNKKKLRADYPVILGLLLEFGAKPVGTAAGDSLALAISAYGMPLLGILVEHGVDVNVPTKGGEYALTLAVKENSVEMSRYLIEQGADLENRDRKEGKTAIFYSLKNPELFWLLAENHASFNVKDNRGFSLIGLSFSQPDTDVIKAIINSGSVLEEVRANGNILVAAVSKNMPEIVELLIRQGADIEFQSHGYYKATSLQLAFIKKHKEIALVLINAGADISHTKAGTAPFLIQATKSNNIDVIKALLKAGTDVNEAYSGSTALYAALMTTFTASGMNIEIVELLLARGARGDAGDFDKNLLVMNLLCGEGDLSIVKKLYEVGAPLNQSSKYTLTPLIGASRNGSVELIEYLLDQGARINDYREYTSVSYWDESAKIMRPDNLVDRQSPLMTAAVRGNRDALDLLVRRGADVNVTMYLEMNALMMVVDGGVHAKDVVREKRRIDTEKYAQEKGERSSIVALKAFKDETSAGKIQAAPNVKIISTSDIVLAGPEREKKYVERREQKIKDLQDKRLTFRLDMMKTLIKADVEVNRQDEVFGLTALMQAIRAGDSEAVKLLLSSGARLDIRDKAGRTAADHANEAGNREIVEMIRRAGSG